MARRWLSTLALALIGCGGSEPRPAPPAVVEPGPAVTPEPRPAPTPASPVLPARAARAEGPSADPSLEGACALYIEVAMSCMEQLAAAGKFPADQLDQIRRSFEQALQARVDASPEQREAMDQACQTALDQQQQAWARSGCVP